MMQLAHDRAVEWRRSFDAGQLLVEALDLDLAVTSTCAGVMSLRLSGTADELAAVTVDCESDPLATLRVSGACPPAAGGSFKRSRLALAVAIPRGRPVLVHDVTGEVAIGDTDAPLALRLGDGVRVRAGRLAGADVAIAGDARAVIDHVRAARVDIDVTGPGRVCAAGDADRLDVRLLGSGNVLFRGAANDAELLVQGSGHINVTRVRHVLRSSCVGSGDVRVSIPPHENA